MAGSTENYDLYIWEASDEKRETINQMANNSRKIDQALIGMKNQVVGMDNDIDRFNSSLSDINKSIDALEGNTSALRTDITRLRDMEAWKDLALTAFVSAYGAGFVNPSYRKNPYGLVSVRGLIKLKTPGEPVGDVDLATLPAGYRPSGMIVDIGWASMVGGEERPIRINVRPDGRIQARTGESGAVYVSLDSIQPFEGA